MFKNRQTTKEKNETKEQFYCFVFGITLITNNLNDSIINLIQ